MPVKRGWGIATFALIALIMAMAIAALHRPAQERARESCEHAGFTYCFALRR
jgi:hypothetical protein